MAVLNLYSKRRRAALQAGSPDVYQYDRVPSKLRVQVVHLWRDAIGTKEPEYYNYSQNRIGRRSTTQSLEKRG
jgi:hypothetical protein